MDKLGPYKLGYNDTNQGIYVGDAKKLSLKLPDESIDLVFTDPVYQNLADYAWLAGEAMRILKPDGNLLVYTTQEHLPLHLKVMLPEGNIGLRWGWLFSVQLYGRRAPIWKKNVQACGQLIAWLTKSEHFLHPGWADDFIGVQARQKTGHEWRKGMEETIHYLKAFVPSGGIVLDPFCGGGTVPRACAALGISYVSFEINPETAHFAQKAVKGYPVPEFNMYQEPLL